MAKTTDNRPRTTDQKSEDGSQRSECPIAVSFPGSGLAAVLQFPSISAAVAAYSAMIRAAGLSIETADDGPQTTRTNLFKPPSCGIPPESASLPAQADLNYRDGGSKTCRRPTLSVHASSKHPTAGAGRASSSLTARPSFAPTAETKKRNHAVGSAKAGLKSEVRSRKSEVRGQKSEVRGQRSEVRGRKTDEARRPESRLPDFLQVSGFRSQPSLRRRRP